MNRDGWVLVSAEIGIDLLSIYPYARFRRQRRVPVAASRPAPMRSMDAGSGT